MDLTKQRWDNFITVGKVINTYGLLGNIKVDVYFDNFKLLRSIKMFFVGNSLQKTKITFCKNLKKSIWIASIAEIKEKETAEDLKGQLIYLEKKFLPKLMADEFYYEDLKGLEVKIIGSIKKGIIKNVFDFGSGDVLEVSLDDKEPTIYIPFDKDNVDRVDLANKKIFLTPIEGLI